MLAGPLHLLIGSDMHWGAWLLIAPAVGVVLQQTVRWRFESNDSGFRSPRRAALAAIIERGGLAGRVDCGDLAYQVYEIVFYQSPEWEAIRGHAHRCWEWTFLFQSMALGAMFGSLFAAFAALASPHFLIAILLLLTLPVAAVVLLQKAQQTESSLQLFDRGLVHAHWPLYEAVLMRLNRDDTR